MKVLDGGGLYLRKYDVCDISSSTFSGNLAGRFGGGLYTFMSTKINISDTTFSMNWAEQDGGGAYIKKVSIILTLYAIYLQNEAENSVGSGMYIVPKVWTCQLRTAGLRITLLLTSTTIVQSLN